MIGTIKKNGNDGLNQCCYSSQWNLHPLKSTMSFLQQRGRERESSRDTERAGMQVWQVVIFIFVWLQLNSRSSTGNNFPSICWSPTFLLLYFLLFFPTLLLFLFLLYTKKGHLQSDFFCISRFARICQN